MSSIYPLLHVGIKISGVKLVSPVPALTSHYYVYRVSGSLCDVSKYNQANIGNYAEPTYVLFFPIYCSVTQFKYKSRVLWTYYTSTQRQVQWQYGRLRRDNRVIRPKQTALKTEEL